MDKRYYLALSMKVKIKARSYRYIHKHIIVHYNLQNNRTYRTLTLITIYSRYLIELKSTFWMVTFIIYSTNHQIIDQNYNKTKVQYKIPIVLTVIFCP